ARRVARQVAFGIIGAVRQLVRRHVCTSVESYISHCHNRRRHRSTNSNRNQLLLHWEKLLRYMKRRPPNDMTSSVRRRRLWEGDMTEGLLQYDSSKLRELFCKWRCRAFGNAPTGN